MTDEELHLLRDFRADVPEPDRETTERIYRLVTAARAGGRSSLVRPLALLAAAVAVSAAVALAVTAPWQGGPRILDKASAAISAPAAGQVLYERSTFTNPTIVGYRLPIMKRTKGNGTAKAVTGWFAVWVQGGGGKRSFRSITANLVPAQLAGVLAPGAPWGDNVTLLRPGRRTLEVGGLLGPQHVIEADVYQPQSNQIIRYTQGPTAISSTSFDLVGLIRQALANGHAHLAGTATVQGQKVEQIDLTIHEPYNEHGSVTYYVDARTFRPVEIVFHHTIGISYPYQPIFDNTERLARTSEVVFRFTAFRYLPATPANLALTTIHAQHPHAKLVCGQEFGFPDC